MDEKRTGEDIHIVPGDIVSGLEPSDLVEIKRIVPFGSKILIEGIGVQSRREIKRPLTIEELSVLIKIRGKVHTFKGDPTIFLLGAEAERIRIAHQFRLPLLKKRKNLPKACLCAEMMRSRPLPWM